MRKPFIILEYKYPDEHWVEYDRTTVLAWAELQMQRMIADHPTADHRMRKEKKK